MVSGDRNGVMGKGVEGLKEKGRKMVKEERRTFSRGSCLSYGI